jgi:hypothetical protein
MKLEGSSGLENNGVINDHTTIKKKNAAPIFKALRAANVFTTPKHRHFARTPLRLLALVTSTGLGQALQQLRVIGHEQLWLLDLAAMVFASPAHVQQLATQLLQCAEY